MFIIEHRHRGLYVGMKTSITTGNPYAAFSYSIARSNPKVISFSTLEEAHKVLARIGVNDAYILGKSKEGHWREVK